jgi:hypothetical protein
MEIGLEISGDADLAQTVQKALEGLNTAAIGPLVEEAETIMAASKEIVPVLSGDLRNSGDAVGINIEREGDVVSVAFGYGGLASSYAVLQHETPPEIFSHAPGKMWKYLERPVYEAAEGMAERLASKMATRIAVGSGYAPGPEFGSAE